MPAITLQAWLDEDYWLELATHANMMAANLREGLAMIPGVRIPWAQHANEVFCVMDTEHLAALQAAGVTCYAPPIHNLAPECRIGADEVLVRFVASWSTTQTQVQAVLDILQQNAGSHSDAPLY